MSYIKQFQNGKINILHTNINPPFAKSDFPIFQNNAIVWFDNGATTHKPASTINCITEYYQKYNSNIHRSPHKLSMISSEMFDQTRTKTAGYIGSKPNEIIFVRGTTEGINLLANSINFNKLYPAGVPTVLITNMEHHSNIVPWQILQKNGTINLQYIYFDKEQNKLNLNELESMLIANPSIAIVSITHVSNVLGITNPIKNIAEIVHKHNRILIVDGAQSVGHYRVDVKDLGCDFFVCSGHKMFGPNGVGFVYVNENLYQYMNVWMGGGSMIKDVSLYTSTYQDPPYKFEAGTPNIADIIAFGTTLDYLSAFDWSKIETYEKLLTEKLYESIRTIPGVDILANTIVDKVPVCSFAIKGIDDAALLKELDKKGISLRFGHHCAQIIIEDYGYKSVYRCSLAPYNTIDEINYFVTVVKAFVLKNQINQ